MSANVTNPPNLIAQETDSWCFAAAEQMARGYLNLPVPSQYCLAYDCLLAMATAQADDYFDRFIMAQILDFLNHVTTDITPAQLAISGNQPNNNSEVVQLARGTRGYINPNPLGGTMSNDCSPQDFQTDIQADKIVLVGSSSHYYVVYGYGDSANSPFSLRVRDPWPRNVGGQTTIVEYDTFNNWPNKVAIRF